MVLAPRELPAGWSAVVDDAAGLAIAFPGVVESKDQKVSQGGRSGRMQEWAYVGDGEAYSVRMLWLDPAPGGASIAVMAKEAFDVATSSYASEIGEETPYRTDGWTGRQVNFGADGRLARLIIATSTAAPERMVSVFAVINWSPLAPRLLKFGDSLMLRP